MIEGAEVLPNARGTAPGQWLSSDGRTLVLLPGPPGEMKPMFESEVLPRLRERAGATSVVRRRVLQDRGDARERGRPDRRARLLGLREPRRPRSSAARPGGAAPRRAGREPRGGRAPHRASWRQRCARPCRVACTARTGATCREVVVGLLRERGLTPRARRVVHRRAARRAAHRRPGGERRPRAGFRDLLEPRQGRGAGRRSGAARAQRRGVRGGGAAMAAGARARGGHASSASRSPASPGPTAARPTSRWGSCSSRRPGRPATACGAACSPAAASACATRRRRSRSRCCAGRCWGCRPL